MTKYESRIGKINHPAENIYRFITDFRNFKQFLPGDKITDWQAEEDSCSFKIEGLGKAGLKILETDPPKTIKITGEGMDKLDFYLWIQLKEMNPDDTRVKVTLKADLNPMLKMVAGKPIEQFLEMLVGRMEDFEGY